MLIHVPRVLWSVARGAYLRPQPGTGAPGRPHIYTARSNALLDVDQFMHMNNAAYAQHFEMARWEMGAATGFLGTAMRKKIAWIVASNVMRFRKELRPLQSFEIHSEYMCADDRSMYMLQLCRIPGDERVCCEVQIEDAQAEKAHGHGDDPAQGARACVTLAGPPRYSAV